MDMHKNIRPITDPDRPKVYIETYGCQMNKAESSSVEQILIQRGWTCAENPENADLVIINTCSVRATAETRIHGRLGWFSALKKSQKKTK
jgi:tRNA-2-methylthio-N6-dimethylallyladenosine synthase